MGILLDTHAWAWSMDKDSRLSGRAAMTINAEPTIGISVVSIFEIAQKVRLGKWPEMAAQLPGLARAPEWQHAELADVTPEIAYLAGTLDWAHRDPFDRLIAATALVNGWVLISADTAFDTLTGLRRIW